MNRESRIVRTVALSFVAVLIGACGLLTAHGKGNPSTPPPVMPHPGVSR